MKVFRVRFYFFVLLLSLLSFSVSAKDKTISEIVNEGKDSYMPGTWDITFSHYSSKQLDTPIKCNKMTVKISNETDAHNNKDTNEVEIIKYDSNDVEIKEIISFEDLIVILDDFDQEFYVKHDIEKLERKNPSTKYSLKGSRFAKRECKNNEYDEIIATQTLIRKKSKEEKEEITILFEMEKRIRNRKE